MRTVQCPNCLRYRGLLTCDAFPDGIPEEILTGQHDHTEPFGSEKLLFSEIPGGLEKADHTKRIADEDAARYERVKGVLKQRGYSEDDFTEESGLFYGMSVNELLDLLEKMDK